MQEARGHCCPGASINGQMMIRLIPHRWTDADMIAAVLSRDNVRLERIYDDCHSYFCRHAGAFFISEANLDDIFQDSLLHLWREIETQRIQIVEGVICRWSDGEAKPMTSSFKTFLMAIAKRKHWEQQRRQQTESLDALAGIEAIDIIATARYGEQLPEEDAEQAARERIVSDSILNMSPRCREILTLFYYEQRTLDDILMHREANTSKTGLKTSKYKCMQRLREMVQAQFKRYGL